jgi:serine/threonine-protein kinase
VSTPEALLATDVVSQEMKCGTCGALLGAFSHMPCLACLAAAAKSTTLPPRPDRYEAVRELGVGGMGVVSLVREIASERQVALKTLRAGAAATQVDLIRFRNEAETLIRLDHPNIVRIYDASGLAESPPFFTMAYVKDGSLAEPANRERFRDPVHAANLMIIVARAVQFAHEHGVLHRDLKPANILLGPKGNPLVSDFGVAKLLDRDGTTQAGAMVGTLEYMSPEQVAGRPDASTIQADVYGLGAILYWLFAERPPFANGSAPELAHRITTDDPTPPRRFVPSLDRDLETVCLHALHKDPRQRYRSAGEFAEDLGRAIDHHPIIARRISTAGRLRRWVAREPALAAMISASLLFVLFLTVTAVVVAVAQEEELRRGALDTNAFAAKGQAAAVLYKLREYGDAIERAAADPAIQALAESPTAIYPAPALERHARDLTSVLALGLDGRARARWPTPDSSWFDHAVPIRDYFDGAMRFAELGRRNAYVARSFRSRSEGTFRFALSAPIFDRAGKPVGVAVANLATSSALGTSDARPSDQGERLTVLLGPRQRDLPDPAPQVPDLMFLVHPNLRRGEERTMSPEYTAPLHAAFTPTFSLDEQFREISVPAHRVPDYVDPILGGHWLTAFAPVGGTGYIMLVQSRVDDAVRPSRTLVRRFAFGFAVATVGVFAMLGGIVLRTRSRKKR